jgi:uncharacterized membrane protein YqaE (UPF0057 family)
MDNKLVKIIVAILLPPLGVYLHENKITTNFWIDLALTLVGFWVLGIIFALYIILK